MRKLLPLFLVLFLISTADAARPVYTVREYPEVTITGINANTKRISVTLPQGGSQSLSIGPKNLRRGLGWGTLF